MCAQVAGLVDAPGRRTMKRRCLAACATVAALASIAATPGRTFAGTYVMRSCNVPTQPAATMGPWRPVPSPSIALVVNCSVGGGVDFRLPSTRASGAYETASLILEAPRDEQRRVIALKRVRVWGNARLNGTGPLQTNTAIGRIADVRIDLDALGSYGDDVPVEQNLASLTSSVQLALTCGESDRPTWAAAGETACYADVDLPLQVRGIEVTLREDVAPTGSVVGGTLLGNQPIFATHSLEYSASDAASGVAKVEALFGDSVVAAKDLAPRCTFAGWSACPVSDRDTLPIDTREVPDGRYLFKLRTVDAAGNSHEERIQDVEVRNQTSPTPAPTIGLAGVDETRLTARFASSPRSSMVVPWGRRMTIRGRLTGPTQRGLGGVQIDVFERTARTGARETAVGSTQTRPDGTYSYTLASMRPSRTVRLAYGSAAARLLRVKVRAASTLKASLRGTTVHYSGRVVSRPFPASGKRVILEGRAPGYGWAAFAVLRTNRLGTFSGTYRLGIRRPGVRLQIRARVPAERGYPYTAFVGRPIALLVR